MHRTIHQLHSRKNSMPGFSLIEVLVSLSIFTIVVTISVSTLFVLIEGSERARNSQSVITNLSFALDSMTREIRTGTNFYCAGSHTNLPLSGSASGDCTGGAAAFSFTEGGESLTRGMGSNRIGYRLSGSTLQRRLGDGSVSDWADVTSPDIAIDSLQFYVSGTNRGDNETPLVTVYVSGSAGDENKTKTEFNIQTTIIQHLFDI